MIEKKSLNGKIQNSKSEKTGLVQWFNINQHEEVLNCLEDLKKLGITRLRTNVSWADYHRPDGKEWYNWLFKSLGKKVELLPCVIYTPPSIAVKAKSSAPPVNPRDYANFIDTIIQDYGKYFEYIEFWNEPNNVTEYDFTLDPQWKIFCEMVGAAAHWAKEKGKKTVLGGMSPIDPNWLHQMFSNGLMPYIDIVGIHGFPGVFDYNWEGWSTEIKKIRDVITQNNSSAKLWITEAGFSTWQKNEKKQLEEFINAAEADAERMYWYGLKDLDDTTPIVESFQLDDREYSFGMKNRDGSPKLLYTLLTTKGLDEIEKYRWMTLPVVNEPAGEKYVLITGGAGFVGTNVADRILSSGKNVMVYDNLSRAGVQNNLFWLKEKYPDNLHIMVADIRDKAAVTKAVQNAEQVFHFAAQVAVTSSLIDPFHDFEVNARGTLNLLEAIRHSEHRPPVIFTSTNKVYGDLHDLGIVMNGTRYHPENMYFRNNGINEERSLDFHSPYGCTKGIADQYILDYARTFGLKTVVFRMSCIYGPHQFGTEDQGWVAHFLIQALKKNPITLYGDGKQVRDILFVEDLVNAFLLAMEKMDSISGNAFNMGGGVKNTISLLELLSLIGKLSGEKPEVIFDDWRPSDQKYYVSDTKKFYIATGWNAKVSTSEGVEKLYDWLKENAFPGKEEAFLKESIEQPSKTKLKVAVK
ncbi:MAG: NAD-dependent epimerase/dehydratase family protein [Candidatus Dadabacteria bacterium]